MVGSSHSVSVVVGSHGTIDMMNKLGVSISLAIKEVSITLSSKVLHGGMVVSSVERSHGPVEMVDQLRVSLGLPLSIEVSKPGCQVIGGGSKAAEDQKLHGDFWSPSR